MHKRIRPFDFGATTRLEIQLVGVLTGLIISSCYILSSSCFNLCLIEFGTFLAGIFIGLTSLLTSSVNWPSSFPCPLNTDLNLVCISLLLSSISATTSSSFLSGQGFFVLHSYEVHWLNCSNS